MTVVFESRGFLNFEHSNTIITTIFVTDKCLTSGINNTPADRALDHWYLIGSQPDKINFPKINAD